MAGVVVVKLGERVRRRQAGPVDLTRLRVVRVLGGTGGLVNESAHVSTFSQRLEHGLGCG